MLRATYAEFAAALVDVKLPDGSGLDLIALAKTLDPTIPAAAVTGHETADVKNRACELGCVPLAVEIGWRRTCDYAAFVDASTDAGMSRSS